MGLVEDVGSYLDAQSTRFTAGTNLFYNYLPTDPGTAAAIYEEAGEAPQYALAGDLPLWENASIQVVCRSTSSTTARANMNDAWFQLQEVANETVNSRSWLRISAKQSPFLLERDEQGRVVFACNFSCVRRTTAA